MQFHPGEEEDSSVAYLRGAEMYRRLEGRSWEDVPLETFLPAWFALEPEDRMDLLAEHRLFVDELDVRRWRANMVDRGDERMRAVVAEVPAWIAAALVADADKYDARGVVHAAFRSSSAPPPPICDLDCRDAGLLFRTVRHWRIPPHRLPACFPVALFRDGALHHSDDTHGPLLVYDCGAEQWHEHGNTPVVLRDSTGTERWFWYGFLHRDDDLPAVTTAEGTKMWYQFGELHRRDNLPAIAVP